MKLANPWPDKYTTLDELVQLTGLTRASVHRWLTVLGIKAETRFGVLALYPADTGDKLMTRTFKKRGPPKLYSAWQIAKACCADTTDLTERRAWFLKVKAHTNDILPPAIRGDVPCWRLPEAQEILRRLDKDPKSV